MKTAVPLYPADHYFSPGELPLHVHKPSRHRRTQIHTHGFTELAVVQAGRVVHVTEEEEYPAQAGDVFVIHEGDVHGYRGGENLVLLNILYHSGRLLSSADAVRKIPGYHAMFCIEPQFRRRYGPRARLHLTSRDLNKALKLIDSIRDELDHRAPGYELLATALFLQLVGFLSRRYTQSLSPQKAGALRLGEVISFLEEHYDQPIRLKQLADMAHVSPRHLLRTFREATGLTPIEYLLHRRIRKAMELLRTGDRNVTEVAFAVGFSDGNYFSRLFRKITGRCPTDVKC
jgi:AraC-like DNA-binding protein